MQKRIDPFAAETVKLRVPLKLGGVAVGELHFKPPKIKDALRTDRYEDRTIAAALALMSSLTGQPEALLGGLAPEGYAGCAVILARTNMRFLGQINLFDQENPTEAEAEAGGAQQPNLPPASAA